MSLEWAKGRVRGKRIELAEEWWRQAATKSVKTAKADVMSEALPAVLLPPSPPPLSALSYPGSHLQRYLLVNPIHTPSFS